MRHPIRGILSALIIYFAAGIGKAQPAASAERMFEATFQSQKAYADPFNDVEVDVVFERGGNSWRVPTFWRGGNEWTVRFAPSEPGEYTYHLESTDKDNPELNGHAGSVTIFAYHGSNPLLQHGMLRVSTNKRYFEHVDGTPFYWLGDTWWTGLSDRLPWEGFKKLTDDRKAKGFTVVQIVGGLVPSNEEIPPTDPGDCNEGGSVWEPDFKRINPRYFDYADRRIQYLLHNGIVPAIVGCWHQVLPQMGAHKVQQHWRNLIARYGSYPVFWIMAGEVTDPPQSVVEQMSPDARARIVSGWTDIARYIRATDPYHHPLTVHERPPPNDYPLQDESLSDFDLFQSSHFGNGSLAVNVAQMNLHYARTVVTKPIVQGEIGYEKIGGVHLDDFQRAAFWLSMLNGAAGHTYGADGTFEVNTADKPLHRLRWSFLSWEEGMNLPGSYEVGMNAKLLREYRWWLFQPHPEWMTPPGTTLLEPRNQVNGFDMGSRDSFGSMDLDELVKNLEEDFARGEWKARQGSIRNGYAAGIPGEVRMVYLPATGLVPRTPPTVLGLEPGVRYHAFLWEPVHGIRFDLGAVERPAPGKLIFQDGFGQDGASSWNDSGTKRSGGFLVMESEALTTLKQVSEKNAVVVVSARSNASAGLALRYRDKDNHTVAVYSPEKKLLYLVERKDGKDGRMLGKTSVGDIGGEIRLSAEVRDGKGIASITDGKRVYTTPIVDLGDASAGSVGLVHYGQGGGQRFKNFEVRSSPELTKDDSLDRKLYDARGEHRGDLVGSGGLDLGILKFDGWDSFGRDKHILLDAYRPERFPSSGDWLLVLEAKK